MILCSKIKERYVLSKMNVSTKFYLHSSFPTFIKTGFVIHSLEYKSGLKHIRQARQIKNVFVVMSKRVALFPYSAYFGLIHSYGV